jgi:hypothetical protein
MATAITRTPAKADESATFSGYRTVADLLEHLGGVAPSRVRFQPWPGTATVRDVIAVHDAENRLCELVDGVLVEKVMGFDESSISAPVSAWFGTPTPNGEPFASIPAATARCFSAKTRRWTAARSCRVFPCQSANGSPRRAAARHDKQPTVDDCTRPWPGSRRDWIWASHGLSGDRSRASTDRDASSLHNLSGWNISSGRVAERTRIGVARCTPQCQPARQPTDQLT